MDDEVMLHGCFQQYPECSKTYTVQLGRTKLIFEESLESRTYTKLGERFTSLLLKDIVASRLFHSKIVFDTSAYFQVIAYPLTNISKNRLKRKRRLYTFRVNEFQDAESNMVIAETWARSLEWLIKNPSITQEDLREKNDFPKKRRILVLINPKSGNGSSVTKFKKFVEPVFIDAGIYYHQLVTKSANQAIEIAYSLNLHDWEGIAICSGDGLAFEVIQGLMQRDDWENAIKMPIGMIPTGSGNALCASILHFSKDVFDIISAAFSIVRGDSTSIDLCSIQNESRKAFAFLSLTWGMISDIDIESERFRLLGNARFTAGAVSRVLALRIYSGKLSFLPSVNEENRECSSSSEVFLEGSDNVEGTKFHAPTQSSGIFTDELKYAKLTQHSDGMKSDEGSETNKLHIQRRFSNLETTTGISGKIGKTLKQMSLGSLPNSYEYVHNSPHSPPIHEDMKQIKPKGITKRAFSTSDFGNGSISNIGFNNGAMRSIERPILGPENTELSPLGQELAKDWVTVDGEFVTVMVLLISHLGSALFSCPGLELGDGDMWLMFIRKGISRKSLVDILTKMETGGHVSNKDLEIHRIKGFRLEPKFERSGYIAVDGEAVEYEAVQGQIHKGLGRVFACHP